MNFLVIPRSIPQNLVFYNTTNLCHLFVVKIWNNLNKHYYSFLFFLDKLCNPNKFFIHVKGHLKTSFDNQNYDYFYHIDLNVHSYLMQQKMI